MKPADKPCYFCDGVNKILHQTQIDSSNHRKIMICRGCGNITFFTILEITKNVIESKYITQEEKKRLCI